MSPQTFSIPTKQFHQKIPSQLSAGLLSRCSAAWCRHHSRISTSESSAIMNTLTSPKVATLWQENKPHAAGLPLIHSPLKHFCSVKAMKCLLVLTGYHDNHIVIRWFWAAVERFNNEQRLRLLQVRNQLFWIEIVGVSKTGCWTSFT